MASKMLKHAQVLLDHLNSLYQRHLLTDVVLLVEDQRYQVHAAVLVAYSKHFQGVLEQSPQPQTKEILLDNTTAPCVESLLQFLYTGKLTLDPANVVDMYMLHSLANQLKIETLEQACQEVLKTKDSSNISHDQMQDDFGHIKLENMSETEEVETEACKKTNSEELLEDLEAKASQEDTSEAKPKLDNFGHIYGTDFVTGSCSESEEVSDNEPASVDDDDDNDDDWKPHSQKLEPDWEEDEKKSPITKKRRSRTRRTPRNTTALESCGSSSQKKSARKRKLTETGGSAKRGRPPTSPGTGDYKCHHCNKRFESNQQLSGHISSHSKKHIHCRHCQGNFRSWPELELHLVKHGLTQAEVELERKNPAKVKLRHSEINHMGQVLWVCLECSAEYNKVQELANHMKATHPAVKMTCFKCPYSTQLQHYLDRHIRKHKEGERPIECEICSKRFTREIRLRRHKHKKHGVIDPALKLLQCPEEGCDFTGWTQFILKKHSQNAHTPKNPDERHFCDICGTSFGLKASLQNHIVRKHSSVSKFICDQCGCGVHTAHELKRHQEKHNPIKNFQCEHCPYATYAQINLKGHLFRKHGVKLYETMRLYGCNHCSFKGPDKSTLNKHISCSHPNESQRKVCPMCNKAFKSHIHYSQHHRVVHMERAFKCKNCTYRASNGAKLAEHVRTQHTQRDYKPFQCPYCAFVCATGNNCLKHVRNRHKGSEETYIKVDVIPPPSVQLDLYQACPEPTFTIDIQPRTAEQFEHAYSTLAP